MLIYVLAMLEVFVAGAFFVGIFGEGLSTTKRFMRAFSTALFLMLGVSAFVQIRSLSEWNPVLVSLAILGTSFFLFVATIQSMFIRR